jgi:hypothetical protein
MGESKIKNLLVFMVVVKPTLACFLPFDTVANMKNTSRSGIGCVP